MTPTLPGRPTLTLDATLAPDVGPSELATLLLTTGRTAASVARVNRTTECRRSSATALSRRNTSSASIPASKERRSHREQGIERTVTRFTHESLLKKNDSTFARARNKLRRQFLCELTQHLNDSRDFCLRLADQDWILSIGTLNRRER
jgi:hypothetical protein